MFRAISYVLSKRTIMQPRQLLISEEDILESRNVITETYLICEFKMFIAFREIAMTKNRLSLAI